VSRARWAGLFYLIHIALGSLALAVGREGAGGIAVSLAASLSYAWVIVLLYGLFKPAAPRLSLIAALVGWTGCLASTLGRFGVASPINPLAIFGLYCLLLAALILRSRFLPRAIGVALAIGGLSWLTFACPALVHVLYPYNMAPGILAEVTLTLWLLVRGAATGPRTTAPLVASAQAG
jgi:uncharacterized protein DUF4386